MEERATPTLSDDDTVLSREIHGFADASEVAYAAVVYLRISDTFNQTHLSLVMSKPIERLTIPRLELCGAQLLAQLIHHIHQVLDIPLHAWTDSTKLDRWKSQAF